MKYNRSLVTARAWIVKRKYGVSWPEAMRRGWSCIKARPINSGRVEAAKIAAGIPGDLPTFTWKQWHDLGFEVIHGSNAKFQVELLYPSAGAGRTYLASFFTFDQIQPIEATV